MEHRTIIGKYQAWSEKQLAAGARRNVEEHLDGCDECRAYYEKMSLLIEKTDPALLPRLAPDPYLPARIRALVEDRKTVWIRRRALGWLRLSAAGVMIVLAAAGGVYLGQGLSAVGKTAEETDIAEAYYEAFAPSDFSGVWETVLSDTERNGTDEGKR